MRKGSKWSPEQRAKIQPFIKKGWKHTEETKKKIGLGNKGKVRSQAMKEHMRDVILSRPEWLAANTERIKKVRPPEGYRPPKFFGEDNPSKRPEVREKIRQSKLGIARSPGSIAKMKETLLRKFGYAKTDPSLRHTPEMDRWRMLVLVRDNFTCTVCSLMPRTKDLVADHIKPFRNFPELIFEVENGRTLCKSCHYKTPTYGRGALTHKLDMLE